MREDLLAQLEEWHEEDEYEQIVDAILEIPETERDYELIGHLGRAYNNLERYEEAIEQFQTVAEEGKNDALWHYRIGLAYYYLEQYEAAYREFTIADYLEPGDEDTLEFLQWIREKNPQDQTEAPQARRTGPADNMVKVSGVTDADFTHFWNDSAPGAGEYIADPPSDGLIESVEEELVFKLPAFYLRMMKQHNGGIPQNRVVSLEDGSQIEISGILGIGRGVPKSLCGTSGSRFIIEDGGYPEIGVVIADCLSNSGVVMLDYRSSGNDGEPEVVHVDKDNGYSMTRIAPNVEAFFRALA